MAAFQEQLNGDAAVATMEVSAGEEPPEADDTFIAKSPLTFGPYNVSPLIGLNFDTADDTAAS